MKRRSLALLVAAAWAGLLVGIAGWFVADRHVAHGAHPTETASANSAPAPALSAPQRELSSPAARDEAPKASASELPAKSPAAEAPSAEPAKLVDFTGQFVRPDGNAVTVPSANVIVRAESGGERSVQVESSTQLTLSGLAPDRYEIEVMTDDYTHRAQSFDLTRTSGAVEERLYLWPREWIAVVVRTSDGRPFADLARELGLDPKSLFVGAFAVRTRRDAPGDDSAKSDPDLAVFRPPPRYQSWELPGSAVGSLQLLQPPPMWIGLDLLGLPLTWKHLASDTEREVVFELDSSAFGARFASLSLQVVDARGAPSAEARVTLRADTSAHRRKEQDRVAPDAQGRITFARIVPGRYELAIEGGGGLYQDRFDLAAGEQRDLGAIALGSSAGIDLQVVDDDGAGLLAWIEVGPYRKGARADDLYPPNINRATDENGRYRLPLPAGPSIVRAMPFSNDERGVNDRERRSHSILIDPAAPPASLVIPARRALTLDLDLGAAGAVDVLDELDLVVHSIEVGEPKHVRVKAPPGRYRVRRAGDGEQAAFETWVELVSDTVQLHVP